MIRRERKENKCEKEANEAERGDNVEDTSGNKLSGKEGVSENRKKRIKNLE
jgi:hypothetical protein